MNLEKVHNATDPCADTIQQCRCIPNDNNNLNNADLQSLLFFFAALFAAVNVLNTWAALFLFVVAGLRYLVFMIKSGEAAPPLLAAKPNASDWTEC